MIGDLIILFSGIAVGYVLTSVGAADIFINYSIKKFREQKEKNAKKITQGEFFPIIPEWLRFTTVAEKKIE